MKNTALKLSGIILLGTLVFISCKKKSPDPEPDPTAATTTTTGGTTSGNPVTAPGFTWTAAGGSATVADSSFYVEGGWGSGIRAYKGGNLKFEINFQPTTLSATTYTFGSGGGLTYIDNGNYFDDHTSPFHVTAVANNKASGNYTGTGINSTTSASLALTVQFVDIRKK
jgi:hypothetical protein